MASNTGNMDASSLFSVPGLVAVITGGGSGLGAMMARALAANGAAKVFIIGRREESLQRTVASLPQGADVIVPVTGDVTSKSSLEACVEEVRRHTDHVNVLIANAGISGPPTPLLMPDGQPLPFEQFHNNLWGPEMEDVTQTYHVNITAVFYSAVAFLPLLQAANTLRPSPSSLPRPQIITTSSIGAYNRRPIGNFSYGPSKAAVVHLTKQLATMLVPYDIRCNAVAPGLYLSEMTEPMFRRHAEASDAPVNPPTHEGSFPRDVIPATRWGDDQDMAGMVLYLCSRAGSYVNGTISVSDGGRLGVLPNSY